MDGHSTYGHLFLLRQFLCDLRPDYAIYLIGVNDVGRGDLNGYDRELSIDSGSIRNRFVAASELLSTVQVLSRTYRAIELGVNHDPALDIQALPEKKVSGVEIERVLAKHCTAFLPSYRHRVEQLVQQSVKAGIRPVLVTQPALYGPATDPSTGVTLYNREHHGEGNSGLQWRVLELYNDVTRTVANQYHVPIVDLASKMPKDSRYYFDWIHFTADGAAVVSTIIADAMRAELSSGLARLR